MPETFMCERQKTRLTVAGCVRMFNAAHNPQNAPKPWESRAACVGCPVGAGHAGHRVNPVAEEVHLLATTCPRCLRQSDRIINGHLCVSCYNRHAEVLRGRNAKGSVPRLSARLHDLEVAVSAAGSGVEIRTERHVTGAAEIIVAVARHAESPLRFGWVASRPADMEALFTSEAPFKRIAHFMEGAPETAPEASPVTPETVAGYALCRGYADIE